MDNICYSRCFMASGIDQWLHYWRIHSHPAGHRHCRGADSGYSGTKAIVTLAAVDEAFGKEPVYSRIILPERERLRHEPFNNHIDRRNN